MQPVVVLNVPRQLNLLYSTLLYSTLLCSTLLCSTERRASITGLQLHALSGSTGSQLPGSWQSAISPSHSLMHPYVRMRNERASSSGAVLRHAAPCCAMLLYRTVSPLERFLTRQNLSSRAGTPAALALKSPLLSCPDHHPRLGSRPLSVSSSSRL